MTSFQELQKNIQLDTYFSGGHFYGLVKSIPGRVREDDFVFFRYPVWMDPNDYMIAMDTMDTSEPAKMIRTIGPLRESAELPFVHYDAYASIYVLPKADRSKPTFYARLNRGSTYEIPDIRGKHRPGMKHEMRRYGMLVAGADQSNLAY